MAGFKLSASVGDKGKNKPKDVLLITNFLYANGFQKVAISDKLGSEAKVAIAKAQIRAGLKPPNYTIEPDDQTFKFLAPKGQAAIKKLGSTKYHKLKVDGKIVCVPTKDYEKARADLLAALNKICTIYGSLWSFHAKIAQEAANVLSLRDGLTMAIANAVTVKVGGVKLPDKAKMAAAQTAYTTLRSTIQSKSFKNVDEQLKNLIKTVQVFVADVQRYLREFQCSAYYASFTFGTVSAVGFLALSIMAAPVVAAGTTLTLAEAGVVSAATTTALSSGSGELGKFSSGQKGMTVMKSAGTVLIDTAVAVVTAGIGNKVPIAKFVDDAAESLAAKFTAKLMGSVAPEVADVVTKQSSKAFIRNYIQQGSKATIDTIIGDTIGNLGKLAKSGKTPKPADFKIEFSSMLWSALSGAPLKDLERVSTKLASDNRGLISKNLVSPTLKKLGKSKGIELNNDHREAIIDNINQKIGPELLKIGFQKAYAEADGSQSKGKLVKSAQAAMLSNGKIKSRIDMLIKAELDTISLDG